MWGAEKQLLRIATMLKSTPHRVTIISKRMKGSPNREHLSDRINIERVFTTGIPGLSMLLFTIALPIILLRIHLKERINIIVLPLPDFFIFTVSLLTKLLRIPLIARVAADELNPIYSHGFWYIVRLMIRSFILKTDAIQTLNPTTHRIALEQFCDPNKVYLIPNGVDLPEIPKDYNNLSKRILYVGAMRHYPDKLRVEQKNLMGLIDAFGELLKLMPDIKLVLVGDGNYRTHLEAYTRSKRWETSVSFEGYQRDVRNYHYNSDILVNASHYEGLPNAVIEAMATGMYVLCSDILEHRYLLGNNKYGGLFDRLRSQSFVEKVVSFYDKPEVYIKKAGKARKLVEERFSIDTTFHLMMSMFVKVVHINAKPKLNAISNNR